MRAARALCSGLAALALAACGEAADAPSAADAGAPGVEVEHRALGTVAVGAEGAREAVTFDLPSDARAFALTLQTTPTALCLPAALEGGPGAPPVPAGWRARADDARRCADCPNPLVGRPGATTVLVPNGATSAGVGGGWWVDIACVDGETGAPTAAEVSVHLSVLRGEAPADAWLALPLVVAAPPSADHDRLQRAVDVAAETYAAAHIRFEPLHIVAHEGVRVVDDLDRDLPTVFADGAALPPGLPVFVVDRIGPPPAGPADAASLGAAGGIPGPVGLPGGPRSGIALALTPYDPSKPDPLGAVLAHELGHHLGLFHTSEPAGSPTDPLPDTADADGRNLMHWYVDATPGALSPHQIEVLRRSPWLTPTDPP